MNKNEFTILSLDDDSYFPVLNDCTVYAYNNGTPEFWSIVTGTDLEYKNAYMTSTREVDDNNNIGINIKYSGNKSIKDALCFSLKQNDFKTGFISLENTEKIAVKPVMKDFSYLDYIIKFDHYKDGHFDYGVYPFEIVREKEEKKELERAYKKNKLIKTGKQYTIASKKYEEYALPSEFDSTLEHNMGYYLSKKDTIDVNIKYLSRHKYIRFTKESPSKFFNKKEVYWVSIKPIKWFGRYNMAISEYNVFSGVPLTLDNKYYGNIKNTYLYEFLNNIFSKEILPLKDYFMETAIEKLNMDDNTRELFYEIINNDIDILKKYSTEIILYYIKNNYSGLKDEEYEKIVVGVLKYISLTENNYFYQEVEEEKKKKNLEDDNIIINNKIKEYNTQMRLKNKSCEEIADDVSKDITSDMSVDEITEAIYTLYPYLKNEELETVLFKIDIKQKVKK